MANRFGKNGWTFSQVPIWAVCDPRIKDKAFRLLAYLVWRQGTDAGCWPSVSTISKDLGSTRRTVQRNLDNLLELGYVELQERPGKSNVYFAIADPGEVSDTYTPQVKKPTIAVPAKATAPPKTRKPKVAEPRPPAVDVFREAAHCFPPKSWWEKVAVAVGEADEDLARWRGVVEAWVGRGYNPKNVAGMLDWFKQGFIPERGGNGRQRNGERGKKRERPRVATELGDWDSNGATGELPDLP